MIGDERLITNETPNQYASADDFVQEIEEVVPETQSHCVASSSNQAISSDSAIPAARQDIQLLKDNWVDLVDVAV